MVFSSDGRLLASTYENDIVRFWNTATGVLQYTLKGHSQSATAMRLRFSSDDRLLAYGNRHCALRL